MQEWFEQRDEYDPMNNYKNNWNCLYYTAKLMTSDGDLFPDVSMASSFHNDYADNCAATGKCEHRYTYKTTPGHMRYNKCDIGTVRYTRENKGEFYQWLVDVEKRAFGMWEDDMSYDEWRQKSRAAEAEVVQKLQGMLERSEDAVPANVHGYEEFVWIGAHDVHKVPGAFDEVMQVIANINIEHHFEPENKVAVDHPVWLYLQSKPYTKFDGTVTESENVDKFNQGGGFRTGLTEAEVRVLLQSPRIRLRSDGGGQFPGICGERYDYGPSSAREKQLTEVWYGTNRRRSSIGVPGEESCHYGPPWTVAYNLSRSVVGFEFRLANKEVVQTAYDDREILNLLPHDDRVQYIKDSRALSRDMFCNPDDYDEFILYRAQPGEEHCTEAKLPDEPECTLVRKCDLSGMQSATQPGFTSVARNGEPASQPEYGSFLVVYEVCPKLIGTLGVAFGFIGQIEMFITFIILGCSLACGCVKIQGEESGGVFRKAGHVLRTSLECDDDPEDDAEIDPPKGKNSSRGGVDL